MKSLRSRLILSHILPVIIVLPLVGVVLVYILETQVLLANLSDELSRQAVLAAEIVAGQPDVLTDSSRARLFITELKAFNTTEINLLDSSGNLLASNDPNDATQIGQPLENPHLVDVLGGQQTVQVNYTLNLHAEIVEVLVPVSGENQEIVGVVRLSRQLSAVYERFLALRYFTAAVLGLALLIALILGLTLALNLERALRRVAEAIHGIATGQQWATLPEHGPKEIQMLLHAFNTLIERLRVLEEARRRLLANLVHEVGRPIGAVQSALHALRSGADEQPELRRELLGGIETEINRLPPLLDNLANLHEQLLGTLELNRQAIDLSEWLPPTILPWREAAHQKGLHWQTDIPATLPTMEIDPNRVAQVLGNLLSNAIKYTPEGGKVSVLAGEEKGQIQIQVSDTGPGIAEVERDKIFEPFYRSSRERRFPQGMGLGLTIANDLVTAHGGKINLESTPGRGSRFTVWLPVSPSQAVPEK